MRFQPKTEEELNPIIPGGVYQAKVIKAEDQTSKAGNEMIKLALKIYGPNVDVLVNDYIMEALGHKLRHFCEVAGLLEIYDSGHLQAADCEDRFVYVKLGIEQQEGFPDKNVVKDYVPERKRTDVGPGAKPKPTERKPKPAANGAPADPNAEAGPAAASAGKDEDVPF